MTQVKKPCDYLEDVFHIAVDAGRRILDIYERGFEVEEKADHTPLTEADRASHELISARLKALTPDVPILSEESARVDYAPRSSWTRFWLVDPLDGTKEFVSRNGEFTVNIALIEGNRPVLGVVYVPVTANAYLACQGGGAYKQLGARERKPIKARPFHGDKPIVVASRSHAGAETTAFLEAVGRHDVVSMGSALKFCLVAEGTADVYPRLGPTMEWDTAAAQCVVEEAGGRVVDTQGAPLTYNKRELRNSWFVVSGAGEHDWTQYVPRPK
ncbi:MAG: 3'(2'),5'-bisphosphate nucleotidase CysQ [Pseudomonadota bacterium]|nr:MAG: 3'(2'),5'-bisphosphate nucleotidase CysQ [Pseudomonadota bacterium]